MSDSDELHIDLKGSKLPLATLIGLIGAFVTSLVGGVIWGVQLNLATLDHTRQLDAHQEILAEHTAKLSRLSENQVRISTILDRIERKQ